MSVRNEVEHALRAWNQHELARGGPAVIDFDFAPVDEEPAPVDRLSTFRRLKELLPQAEHPSVVQRVTADLAYLRALMGERPELDVYVRATQGCPATGWPSDYVTARGEIARRRVENLGITWGPETSAELTAAEGQIAPEDAPDAIRQAAHDYEYAVRQATGTQAEFNLTIESANVDAYWAYWLDGAGQNVRLRLNSRNASYTKVQARQFALHEVLGHGLQSASIAAHCATEDVPWVRLSSVHGPQQVLLEGLAQAMPLFVAADDEQLVTRVRIDHYTQLVRSELHLAVNAGVPIEKCAEHASSRIPWWTPSQIAGSLTDRGSDVLLRSYMWSYVAGLDWFSHLAEASPTTIHQVLTASYCAPLTPSDLENRWVDGPAIGGHQ